MLLAAFVVAAGAQSHAGTSNDLALEILVSRYLPACHIELGDGGNRKILRSEPGEILDLAVAGHENPNPREEVIGYWYSPAMDFLGRQKIKAVTANQAISAVQFLHAIARAQSLCNRSSTKRVNFGAAGLSR
jgi:hypothetical protein